jgi:hypothetical protein
MSEPFGLDDLRVLSRYETAGQGAYRTIHARLEQILTSTLSTVPGASSLDRCLTLGFNPASGVRGNRPKDLWCAVFPREAAAYMPQVYVIVSHRGVELGYGAAIHPTDFSNQTFKSKLRLIAPSIFDALPDPASEAAQRLSAEIARQGNWYFRRKARLTPKENEFNGLPELLAFLKSTEGKAWGSGTIARYWLPHDLSSDVNLAEEFVNATTLFQPLMVQVQQPSFPSTQAPSELSALIVPTNAPAGGSIRDDLESFMAMYPDCRLRPFGTNQELWGVLSSVRRRLHALSSIAHRPTVRVSWSVGQGNWARVPWIAVLDERMTDTTQRGVYVVLLFREDMSGVYLTLNQGVTEPKKTHGGTSGLQLLRENAAALRERCRELARFDFRLNGEIDLRTEGTLGRDYEAATIAYKLYERGAVPLDDEIARDLDALLTAYEKEVVASTEQTTITADGDARPIPPAPPYVMEDALRELFLEETEIEDLLTLWRAKKNLILQGPPGVGKTFVARRLAFLVMGHRDQARMRMVQFHQAYTYEDFIQGYRPSENGGFIRRDGAFFDFAKLAEADLDRPYVFIIDEINRGNLSKILGELMMLLEPDKRGPEYGIPLAYSRPDEAPFSVPKNLFVLGLMNTADRSLAMVDYALRRRFVFHMLEPQFGGDKFRSYLVQRGASPQLLTSR